MSETTTTETAATAPASFSQADMDAAITTALARAEEARKARKAAKKGTAAAAETVTPAPAAVTETDDERIARIVTERLAAERAQETEADRINRLVEERLVTERQRLTEQGAGPARKGLDPAGAVTEHSGGARGDGLNRYGLPAEWPDKPLHEFTSDEIEKYAGPALVRHALPRSADLMD